MKNFSKHIFWIPTSLLLVVTVWIMFGSSIPFQEVYSKKGQLHLDSWNHHSLIKLKGEWQYYENVMADNIQKTTSSSYVTVPHSFKKKKETNNNAFGVATYQLYISGLKPNVLYSAQILNELTAYRLIINGQDVLTAGTVANNAVEHQSEMKEKIGHFYADPSGNANVIIEISNFYHKNGGFWKEIVIGTTPVLMQYASQLEAIEIFLFSSTMSVGFFFFALYSTNRDFKPLKYFSFICILIALRTMLTNNRQFYDFIYTFSFDTGTRIEYLAGYLLLPMFGLFFYSLEYIPKRLFVRNFYYILIAMYIIVTICIPNIFYMKLSTTHINLCTLLLIYFLYVVGQGIKKKKPKAVLIFIGMCILIPTFLLDFYSHLTYDYLPFGTFFMLIFMSIAVIKNLLQIKQNHDYLERAITIDSLTGVKNRYFLNKLVQQELPIHHHQPYYILFFDLNKFKFINDTYGHDIGDAVLVESANRLQSFFQAKSDIICRFGGDEFIVITKLEHQPYTITQLTNSISTRFKEPFVINNEEYTLSVSIGIAQYKNGDRLESIIKQSDGAMYTAKKNHQSNVFFVNP